MCAVAVAQPPAADHADCSQAVASLDAAQQASLQLELAHLQQLYFTPESVAPGLPIDPNGGPDRAAAQGNLLTFQ